MKVLIDIDKDIIEDIRECDFEFARDVVKSYQATIADAIRNGMVIPDNTTNGNVMEAMFPNATFVIDEEIDEQDVKNSYVWAEEIDGFSVDLEWWDAPCTEKRGNKYEDNII